MWNTVSILRELKTELGGQVCVDLFTVEHYKLTTMPGRQKLNAVYIMWYKKQVFPGNVGEEWDLVPFELGFEKQPSSHGE